MKLTAKERHALDVLRSADPRYEGEGVPNAHETALIDNQAWVHWRTARSLERKGLVRWDGQGEEATITLLERP